MCWKRWRYVGVVGEDASETHLHDSFRICFCARWKVNKYVTFQVAAQYLYTESNSA